MQRGRFALKQSDVEQAKQASLMIAIETSQETRYKFRRIARTQFARSLGIETEETICVEFVEDEGVEREVTRVVAKDPGREAELTDQYRPFIKRYEHNEKLRKARRAEIAGQVGDA